MNNEQTYNELIELASNLLKIDESEITPDSTFETFGIDSLDVQELIFALEEKYNIELEMEDQKITTFGELADFIESKLN